MISQDRSPWTRLTAGIRKVTNTNTRSGTWTVGKLAVVGSKDGDTKQIPAKAGNATPQQTRQDCIQQHAEAGGHCLHRGSPCVSGWDYCHTAIQHAPGEYGRDITRTSGAASFWAMWKRAYDGPFHYSRKPLWPRYVNAFARHKGVRERDIIQQKGSSVAGMVGKRLMYQALIGKETT